MPLLAGMVDMGAVPERLVLYRGGLGDPVALAGGASWRPGLEVAATFARWRWTRAEGCGGDLVVVRREVGRGEVAAYFVGDHPEAVVPAPSGPWSIEARGEAAVWALGRTAEDYERMMREKAAGDAARVEALWSAWEGGS